MNNIEEVSEPAFPSGLGEYPYLGMTLRDYFAGQAMMGLVARIGKHDTALIAHDAYMMADEMLQKRKA
jgi:hypothetical protein